MTDITIYKQIHPHQCAMLVALGYASIINVRPDHEAPNQPTSTQLTQACQDAKLAYFHVPFADERLHHDTVERFATAFVNCPKPVIIFCGTGHRAKLLYQSAKLEGLI